MTCPRSAGDEEFERLMQQLADNVLLPADLNLIDLELLMRHIGPTPALTALVDDAREEVRVLSELWTLSLDEHQE
jgi:hypothetical protein